MAIFDASILFDTPPEILVTQIDDNNKTTPVLAT
jgi:hypothetical protein